MFKKYLITLRDLLLIILGAVLFVGLPAGIFAAFLLIQSWVRWIMIPVFVLDLAFDIFVIRECMDD